MKKARHWAVTIGTAAALVTTAVGANAESTYKAAIPNAAVNDCNTCHTNGGDTPRNAFGLEVEALVLAQVPLAEWWPQLRDLDSDGDLQSNAQELGDPCITWTQGAIPDRTTSISNPGVAADTSLDPDACEDPPVGEGEGEGEGGGLGEGGAGGAGGSGVGNGDGSGNGNGNTTGAKLEDPDWQYAPTQSGCQTGSGDDSQIAYWLLAVGLLLVGRALRADDERSDTLDG